jgi:hypothetical protein
MNLNRDNRDIPTAKARIKQANLAKDEKIKRFWESLVEDWLRWSKDQKPDKENSKH